MPNVAAAERRMRADAQRNRAELLRAARELFTENGVQEASLDHVAKRAGVGPGTLYRHFPTRDALLAAVYRNDIETIAAKAAELGMQYPPAEALTTWLRLHIDYIREAKGIGAAVKTMLGADSATFDFCKEALQGAVGGLLAPAQEEGAIRPDVTPVDVLRLAHGVGAASEAAPSSASRLLEVVLDGLRTPTSK